MTGNKLWEKNLKYNNTMTQVKVPPQTHFESLFFLIH